MHINFIAVLVAALAPMLVGFIWYNPRVMGNTWMREAGVTQEQARSANMFMLFGLSFVFAFMLAFSMQMLVIHQFHVGSMLMHHEQELKDPNTPLGAMFKSLMDQYGSEFRTFKHGAFHGFLSSVFIILPVIATNAMFERKSWKYIWLTWAYWSISFMLMGGIVSGWQ